MDREILTVITRKGQITLPIEIRRSLGLKEGDKIAVSLLDEDNGSGEGTPRRVVLRPVRSVAEMTFGAVPARKQPEDFAELRRHFEEGIVDEALLEGQ